MPELLAPYCILVLPVLGALGFSPRGRRAAVALPIFLASVVVGVLFHISVDWELEKESLKLRSLSDIAVENIEREVQRNLSALIAVKSLYWSSNEVSQLEFSTFVQGVKKEEENPLAFVWLPHVPRAERRKFERVMRSDLKQDFEILEQGEQETLIPGALREEYYPLVYVEPNREAMKGFDLASVPDLKTGISRTRRERVTTARYLASELPSFFRNYDFIIFKPIDKSGRGNRWLGVVAGLLSVSDLMKNVQQNASMDVIAIRISEIRKDGASQPLYWQGDSYREFEGFSHVREIPFVDTVWRIETRPHQLPRMHYRAFPLSLLIGGFLFTSMLLAYLLSLSSRSLETERLVKDKTRDLSLSNQSLSQQIERAKGYEEELRSQRLVAFNIADDARRAMQKAEEGQARLETVIESSPSGLIGIDSHGVIKLVNQAIEEMFSYRREDLIGREVEVLLPNELREKHKGLVFDFLKDPVGRGMGGGRRLFGVRRDGGEFPLEIGLSPITGGGELKVLAAVTDISKRVEAEKRAKRSEEELQLIFDNVPARIWYKDDQNVILRLNKSAAESMGGAVDDFTGKNTYDLYPEIAKKYHDDDLEVINSGQPKLGIVEEYLPVDGQAGWVMTDKIPGAFSEGDRTVLVVSVDITKQVKTEQELLRSNHELSEFAYVASHDLKAPLRAIKNYAEWIEEDAGELIPEESKVHLEKLRQRTTRMQLLLDDLLAYSRAGGTQGDVLKVNSKELVLDVIELISPPEQFVIDVGADLPIIYSDKAPLELVFRNLIGNAINHHDRKDGRIEVRSKSVGAWVEFSVSDDGPGISEEYHSKIFQMFQSLSVEGREDSTGMGLALVKKTVESRGGGVSIESSKGEGSVFRFLWPRTVEAEDFSI